MVDNLAEKVNECPLNLGRYVSLCILGVQKVSVIYSSGVKSMEKCSGLSELSVISWVSIKWGSNCVFSIFSNIS